METKQQWVKKLRELIQERMMYMQEALKDKQTVMFKSPPKVFNRISRSVGQYLIIPLQISQTGELILEE